MVVSKVQKTSMLISINLTLWPRSEKSFKWSISTNEALDERVKNATICPFEGKTLMYVKAPD